MEPRLGSAVLVKALLRIAQVQGGFGAIIARGDEHAGALTVILAERGVRERVLERALDERGRYAWREVPSRGGADDEEFAAFLDRRRRFDPDMWVLELDVASAERFADEMNAVG